jgi:hypothetical protein
MPLSVDSIKQIPNIQSSNIIEYILKSTNNDIQNIRHKIKDRTTRTRLKIGVNACAPGVCKSCSTCGTRRVTLVTVPVISHE